MKALVATALLVFTVPHLLAARDSAAQRLLDSAKQQSALFQGSAHPLQLEVDFTALVDSPVQGHLTLKWMSRDAWWSKVVIGSFEQVMVKSGGKRYTSRNLIFTPIRVDELIRLLKFRRRPEAWIAEKRKDIIESGTELDCVKAAPKDFSEEKHSICISASSHDILTDDWFEFPGNAHREQFSNYMDFEGHRFPRSLKLQVSGQWVITATVASLTLSTLDSSLLTPPKGKFERMVCDNMIDSTLVSSPLPKVVYFDSNSDRYADVLLTVLPNGAIGDIKVSDTNGHEIQDDRLKNPNAWSFRPAKCGSESITSDAEVIVQR
jgi:hypothetical protein